MADKADVLKLADAHGDKAADKVADATLHKDAAARIHELEKNVADLEKLVKEKKKLEQRTVAANHANKIAARKDASFKAISTAPSINHTPVGPAMVPIPYPTVQDLGNSVNTARSVKFNGSPAYLLDQTSQPGCQGDQHGTGGGIRSGTVGGKVKPASGSSTVRIEGKQVVREGDSCTMNGGNNPGTFVTAEGQSALSAKNAIVTSNPLISKSVKLSDISENGGQIKLFESDLNRTVSERIADSVIGEMLSSKAALQRLADQAQRTSLGPRIEPIPAEIEEGRLRTRNSLELSLLGIFGLHGMIARATGKSELMVAQANKMGAATMGVLGSIIGYAGVSKELSRDFLKSAANDGRGIRIISQGQIKKSGKYSSELAMREDYKGEDKISDNFRQNKLVKYLDENQRKHYEVHFKDGLLYNSKNRLLNSGDYSGIFVMSPNGKIYFADADTAVPGEFHHSSFLAGNSVAAAGEINLKNGVIQSINSTSGHYKPSSENLKQFISELKENGVPDVDQIPIDRGYE